MAAEIVKLGATLMGFELDPIKDGWTDGRAWKPSLYGFTGRSSVGSSSCWERVAGLTGGGLGWSESDSSSLRVRFLESSLRGMSSSEVK